MIIYDVTQNWISAIDVITMQDLSLENLLDYYNLFDEKPFRRFFSEHLHNAFPEIAKPNAVLGAIGNAIKRGNQGDPCKKITIEKYVGKKGIVVLVGAGEGFDFREVDRKFKSGEKYYSYQGNGWKAYSMRDILVQFQQEGKEIWLYYPFAFVEHEFYCLPQERFSRFDAQNYTIGQTYWFETTNLFVKGTRLRPPGDIFEGKTTPAIEDIATSLRSNKRLQTEPLLVYHDLHSRDVVYEGRHRVLGHLLAEREWIAGELIDGDHPKILSKRKPEKVDYYRKRIIPVPRFLEYVLKC